MRGGDDDAAKLLLKDEELDEDDEIEAKVDPGCTSTRAAMMK